MYSIANASIIPNNSSQRPASPADVTFGASPTWLALRTFAASEMQVNCQSGEVQPLPRESGVTYRDRADSNGCQALGMARHGWWTMQCPAKSTPATLALSIITRAISPSAAPNTGLALDPSQLTGRRRGRTWKRGPVNETGVAEPSDKWGRCLSSGSSRTLEDETSSTEASTSASPNGYHNMLHVLGPLQNTHYTLHLFHSLALVCPFHFVFS